MLSFIHLNVKTQVIKKISPSRTCIFLMEKENLAKMCIEKLNDIIIFSHNVFPSARIFYCQSFYKKQIR